MSDDFWGCVNLRDYVPEKALSKPKLYDIPTSLEEIEKFCARTKRCVNLRMLDFFG